ncbi:MAG TPA: ribbon-helix-helix protein, CopG family [Chloroflexota bacterium]|nr:ribbon-helix-helix protein, CopG family [Ardenticatenaceae bacterium]HRQ42616.1 ribbon-helix-helix protein, CopG family [Chloroflexota bacterium]HUM70744.1 ribbon-helix-helix protein, CopG family [Chloroflexota bacterium]
MIRTQIQLTEKQSHILKQRAIEEGVSVAEVIRRSINVYIHAETEIDTEERKRRALSVLGKYDSGLTDLSENHDKYLAEVYGEVGE